MMTFLSKLYYIKMLETELMFDSIVSENLSGSFSLSAKIKYDNNLYVYMLTEMAKCDRYDYISLSVQA